ncbi:MAG: 2-amino-4-hydroxy-6-hydroxymethyldihydropteridine diphosphokinase [Candidatus Marinimicrobia bacterium]|nr:2-amino-4-hydroxy-6-hydroxymethyldihydropteridine diphosphokinase [Candidatus Neomarinimicrobiota bacterium]MBV68070.1 2-amino-4-hydroxy-6-hydroxymethyldihydropteridine diphosphokinase [Candidatus Neomarinimicrobiota bacterium]
MVICFLGIGSNIDDRLSNLNQSIALISDDLHINFLQVSSFYESPPMYNLNLNIFLNGVIKISTSYTPFQLLSKVKKIELKMGRKESVERYENRIIDIDILCCENEIIESNELTVPHPNIKERKFVLEPWCDIDSNYIIVNENRKVKELLAMLPDSLKLRRVN